MASHNWDIDNRQRPYSDIDNRAVSEANRIGGVNEIINDAFFNAHPSQRASSLPAAAAASNSIDRTLIPPSQTLHIPIDLTQQNNEKYINSLMSELNLGYVEKSKIDSLIEKLSSPLSDDHTCKILFFLCDTSKYFGNNGRVAFIKIFPKLTRLRVFYEKLVKDKKINFTKTFFAYACPELDFHDALLLTNNNSLIKTFFSCKLYDWKGEGGKILRQAMENRNYHLLEVLLDDLTSSDVVIDLYPIISSKKSDEMSQFLANFRNKKRETLLHRASSFDFVTLLMEMGADVNAQNDNGDTPLHIACRKSATRIIEALGRRGANPFLINIEYVTPIDLIVEKPWTKSLIKSEIFEETFSISLLAYMCSPVEISRLENKELAAKVQLVKEIDQCWHTTGINPLFHNIISEKGFAVCPQGANKLFYFSKERETIISTDDFFNIWKETKDPKVIEKRVMEFTSPLYSEEPYRFDILRSAVKDKPCVLLNELSKAMSTELRPYFVGQFIGESAIDSGGLSRQLFSQLFLELSRKLNFAKVGSLFLPKLQVNRMGEYVPLSVDNKKLYAQMGHLLMFCVNGTQRGQRPIPIGQLFDLSFFGLFDIPINYLRGDSLEWKLHSANTFPILFGQYKNAKQHDNVINEYNKRLSNCLFDKNLSDEDLSFMYSLLEDDESLNGLNLSDSPQILRSKIIFLQSALTDYVREDLLKPFYEPLFYIAKGMRDCGLELENSFTDIRAMSLETRSKLFQGILSKEDVLSKLDYSDTFEPTNKIIVKTWLESWINAASEDDLKSLIFAASGSESVASNVIFKVIPGPSIAFSTCFYQIRINTDFETQDEFNEKFTYLLGYIRESGDFSKT